MIVQKASITLLAFTILTALTIVLLPVLNSIQESRLIDTRVAQKLDNDKNNFAHMQDFLNEISDLPLQFWSAPEFFAPQYIVRAKNYSIDDLNKYININFANRSLLRSPLLGFDKNDLSVDEFQEKRLSLGPFESTKDVEESFPSLKAQTPKFTTIGMPNINTVDEPMFEKLVSIRTNDSESGLTLRQDLKRVRLNGEILNTKTLASFMPDSRLRGVFSTVPELNINEASLDTIETLLAAPMFGIPNPQALAIAIVEMRKANKYTKKTLDSVVDSTGSPLLRNYLHFESTSLMVTLKSDKNMIKFCVIRRPLENGESTITIVSYEFF